MEVSGQLHTLAALPLGERAPPPSQYPLERKLDGPQNQSECSDEEKNIPSLSLPGIWTLVIQPIV